MLGADDHRYFPSRRVICGVAIDKTSNTFVSAEPAIHWIANIMICSALGRGWSLSEQMGETVDHERRHEGRDTAISGRGGSREADEVVRAAPSRGQKSFFTVARLLSPSAFGRVLELLPRLAACSRGRKNRET